MEAPHLDTKSLSTKLDVVGKTVGLDVSTILADQFKDQVLGTFRSWIRKRILHEAKSPEIQQPKAQIRYCQTFDRLLIEKKGQLLCYIEPPDKLEEQNLLTSITFCSFFYTQTLKRDGWTYRRFKNLQQRKTA